MSRANYDYDIEQWDLIRWRGAVTSAIRGRRGQAFLREMATALDALPKRELVRQELVTASGECCSLGAVALARGNDVSDVDPEDPEQVAAEFGIAEALAREVMYENDECYGPRETPAETWMRMRQWVAGQIREAADHLETLAGSEEC